MWSPFFVTLFFLFLFWLFFCVFGFTLLTALQTPAFFPEQSPDFGKIE
jgi:hypothetical protein